MGRIGASGTPYSREAQLGHLPQGASTSGMLANLVASDLDMKMELIAKEFEATYSRYADDIVFSLGVSSRVRCKEILARAASLVGSYGFRVNKKKTKIVSPGARKIVTGLVLDPCSPKLTREFRDSIELAVYHIARHGLWSHVDRVNARDPVGYLNHLIGKLVFARSVEPAFFARQIGLLKAALGPYAEALAVSRELELWLGGDDRYRFTGLIKLG